MSTLPNFTKDVLGQCYGGAFWSEAEYRVTMTNEPSTGIITLNVEDSGGAHVAKPLLLTVYLIDGILRMSSTDHGLGCYEDDWQFPVGMDRHLVWTLQTDLNHTVVLDQEQIDEIAAWLRFATGEEEWPGGEDWSY